MREWSFQIDPELFCRCIFLGKMQWTGAWGISKMKSKLSHRETKPKLLRGKKYITWGWGAKGRRREGELLSFFSSLKLQFLGRNTK